MREHDDACCARKTRRLARTQRQRAHTPILPLWRPFVVMARCWLRACLPMTEGLESRSSLGLRTHGEGDAGVGSGQEGMAVGREVDVTRQRSCSWFAIVKSDREVGEERAATPLRPKETVMTEDTAEDHGTCPHARCERSLGRNSRRLCAPRGTGWLQWPLPPLGSHAMTIAAATRRGRRGSGQRRKRCTPLPQRRGGRQRQRLQRLHQLCRCEPHRMPQKASTPSR